MIAGANSKGHPLTLNGQTVGGVFIEGAHGSTTAGPMWGDAMKVIQDYLPDESFTTPNPQTIAGPVGDGAVTGRPGHRRRRRRAPQGRVHPGRRAERRQQLRLRHGGLPQPRLGRLGATGSTVTIYVSDGTPYVAPQPPPQKSQGGDGNGATRGGQGPRTG